MIHIPTFRCSVCDTDIQPFDKYLQVGTESICENCVNDMMQEYDPEGDYIDYKYDLEKGE